MEIHPIFGSRGGGDGEGGVIRAEKA